MFAKLIQNSDLIQLRQRSDESDADVNNSTMTMITHFTKISMEKEMVKRTFSISTDKTMIRFTKEISTCLSFI